MERLDALVAQAREHYRLARPRSEALAEEAGLVLPGGNTRSVLDFSPFPFRVESVEGANLIDVDGHPYLDLLGNYSAGLLGHRPPIVANAVNRALKRGWALGAISPDEAELAGLVTRRFPSIDKVRFTNSGTEANLMALATARHVTGRKRVVVFHGGYHGGLLYFGDGGRDLLAPHDWVVLEYNDVAALSSKFDEIGEEIACVLVEPMMAASGCIPGSGEFLATIRSLCSDHAAICIFDEVMTSRLSPGGAQELLGIHADMTTLGKYLAGGLTIGAFGGRAGIMAAFDPAADGALTHGGTFNNNELTMAAGIAVLTGLSDELIVEVNERGDRLRDALNQVFSGHGLPMSTTGIGSLMTIHGLAGEISSPAVLAGGDDRLKELLFFSLLEDGFYMARRGFIALSVEITDSDLDRLVGTVDRWCGRIEAII